MRRLICAFAFPIIEKQLSRNAERTVEEILGYAIMSSETNIGPNGIVSAVTQKRNRMKIECLLNRTFVFRLIDLIGFSFNYHYYVKFYSYFLFLVLRLSRTKPSNLTRGII